MAHSDVTEMCGRFTLTTPDFDAVCDALTISIARPARTPCEPRFNVTPGTALWIVCRTHETSETPVAAWGGGPTDEIRWPINARSETAHRLHTFREAFRNTRCAIPADGFYEWSRDKTRLPTWFSLPNRRPFAFAGLWRTGPGLPGSRVQCTILTAQARGPVSDVHSRMPVLLDAGELEAWLGGAPPGPGALAESLIPHTVSRRVDDPRNDDPECIAPGEDRQLRLPL